MLKNPEKGAQLAINGLVSPSDPTNGLRFAVKLVNNQLLIRVNKMVVLNYRVHQSTSFPHLSHHQIVHTLRDGIFRSHCERPLSLQGTFV